MVGSHPERLNKKLHGLLNAVFVVKAKSSDVKGVGVCGIYSQDVTETQARGQTELQNGKDRARAGHVQTQNRGFNFHQFVLEGQEACSPKTCLRIPNQRAILHPDLQIHSTPVSPKPQHPSPKAYSSGTFRAPNPACPGPHLFNSSGGLTQAFCLPCHSGDPKQVSQWQLEILLPVLPSLKLAAN